MMAAMKRKAVTRNTQSLSITLPHDMARLVKEKVASGNYATESEVIRDGLRALGERDAALENWLRSEGVARYDAYQRDPRGEPAEKIFAQLRQYHAKRLKRTAR
jgi:putative addiction module CopG family antidote